MSSRAPQKTEKSYANALLRRVTNGVQLVVGKCVNGRPQKERPAGHFESLFARVDMRGGMFSGFELVVTCCRPQIDL